MLHMSYLTQVLALRTQVLENIALWSLLIMDLLPCSKIKFGVVCKALQYPKSAISKFE